MSGSAAHANGAARQRDLVAAEANGFGLGGFSKTSGIGCLAAYINAGNADAALTLLQEGDDPSLKWIAAEQPDPGTAALHAILAGYAPYLEAVRNSMGTPDAMFEAFNRFRVLCAVHDTLRGATALNDVIGAHVRAGLRHHRDPGMHSAWYPGRPVMVLRNDYVLGLFNGDIGLTFPDAEGVLMVYFPDGQNGLRAIAPVRLPEHDTAFAMTVHKAQGSEFDRVLLMLPADANRVLSRELIYTAVTRARHEVVIVGSGLILAGAIKTVTVRRSGLLSRLADVRRGSDIRDQDAALQ